MLAHYQGTAEDNQGYQSADEGLGFEIDNDLFERLDEVHQKTSHSFFEKCANNKKIMDRIREAVEEGKPRLEVDITDFDRLEPGIAKLVLTQPAIYLPAINAAIKDLFRQVIDMMGDETQFDRRPFREPRLALKGWLRGNTITPRGLKASRVNSVVALEGIVTRCGTAKHQVVRSIYVAEKSAKKSKVDYQQEQFFKPTGNSIVPIRDADGNRYVLEPGLTEFQNYQVFTVQEMPENAPSGQLPCSVDVVIHGGLVDTIKAGDRVSVWGIYKAKVGRTINLVGGGAKCWIEANNIEHLGGNKIQMQIEPSDLTLMRKISKMPDVLEHLAYSVAPTLFGGTEKKKGLLLQLIGGVAKSLENNTMRVRGDINILLIGDPSCGKSQMLRFMMQVAPLAISTTGRGSSGVGLTAAAKMDEENRGERILEAGAMVMADGGLVCIDEFDKMSNDDRTAIHEVMEQQTVSISKASIQTTLNARCSVLAAANPTYGCFDDTRDIRSQICFPDSLLSRFDLIFLVHEANTPAEDRRICRTVLSNHIFKANEQALVLAEGKQGTGKSGSAAGNHYSGVVNKTDWTILPRDDPTKSDQNYDRQTADGRIIYSISFLKRYIQIAKTKIPELTEEAIEGISSYYTEMRKRCVQSHTGSRGRFAVPTARTLEAAIRLSTAHAKLCLKNKVEASDVRAAKKLLHFSLLGEEYESDEEPEMVPVKKASKRMPRKTVDGIGNEVESSGINTKKRVPSSDAVLAATKQVADSMGVKRARTEPKKKPSQSMSNSNLTEDERKAGLRTVAHLKDLGGYDDTITKEEFLAEVVKQNGDQHIEPGAFRQLLEELADRNKIMVVDDTNSVWLI